MLHCILHLHALCEEYALVVCLALHRITIEHSIVHCTHNALHHNRASQHKHCILHGVHCIATSCQYLAHHYIVQLHLTTLHSGIAVRSVYSMSRACIMTSIALCTHKDDSLEVQGSSGCMSVAGMGKAEVGWTGWHNDHVVLQGYGHDLVAVQKQMVWWLCSNMCRCKCIYSQDIADQNYVSQVKSKL